MGICSGCGLELPASGWTLDRPLDASPECWQLYGEVVGFETGHLELVRDLHQLTVDAYLAQHARAPIGVAYALIGLHLALDRGVPGVDVRVAHQRLGRPDRSWPRLPAPPLPRGLTVFEVATAGLMVGSVRGHAEGVRRWACSVWQAWSPHHAPVAALADRLLAGADSGRDAGAR